MARSPRVALIMTTLPNPARRSEGGVSYVVHFLANQLVRRGVDITVFSLDAPPADALYAHRSIAPASSFADRSFARRYLVPAVLARTDWGSYDVLHLSVDDWLM